MYHESNAPLTPRNGHTLMVGIGARISGCANQKEASLDDQADHGREEARSMYDGPMEFRVIATTGKGERLDRPELAEYEEEFRTGEFDLFIFEDLGRLVRGAEAARLLGIAVDHGVRVIVPNDGIDTADPSWEADAIKACAEHVSHNTHTSNRLKQKLMNRFAKFGQATALPISGYIVPDDARSYDDWKKDENATEMIQEGLHLLRDKRNCSIVANWLNKKRFPTGPYCKKEEWDGKMVRRFYLNPLLKGMPGRGFRRTVKLHENGGRLSKKSPKPPKYYSCPHLAHVDADELDHVNDVLRAQNKCCRHTSVNGNSEWSAPRKETKFPGQYARCWYCGRHFVWGGNGVTENLMCSGSREWRCWNSVGFNGEVLVKKIVRAITSELYLLDGFDDQFRALVAAATEAGGVGAERRRRELAQEADSLKREEENLAAAILEYGPRPMFEQKLNELEQRTRKLSLQQKQLDLQSRKRLTLPASVHELRGLIESTFAQLAVVSEEFGDVMKDLVPELDIHLVRLCDGGHLLPRAKVKLSLAGILPDVKHVPRLEEALTRDLTLDLFELPQRERIREQAVQLAGQRLEQREIAAALDEKPTQTAVYRALRLEQRRRELNLLSPYVNVLTPPEDYTKLRRAKNSNYRFEPKEGYQRTPLP
jgi:hypothetical protein